MNKDLYGSYAKMKGWSNAGGSGDPLSFEHIVSVSDKSGSLSILESGFGDGSFMDWARSVGHSITGIELIPDCVAAAKNRNHDVYLASDVESLEAQRFDLIVAIDVLEHLTVGQLAELANLATKVLRLDGMIVARFPNGDSPFSGRYQNGDVTHERPLSARAVDQIFVPWALPLLDPSIHGRGARDCVGSL
ncbi:MAG TPA: methyltransferase domain-containing protein [Steroidobacteraceae bacterium]